MTIFLCTYAASDQKNAADNLRLTALKTGDVDRVILFDDDHPLILALKEKAGNAFDFSWQFWKPYVIQFVLHNAQPGDVVIYCDPTLTFTKSVQPFVDKMDTDVLLFQAGDCVEKNLRQKFYTKPDCFWSMGCTDPALQDMYQVDSGIQFHKKESEAFVAAYVEFCSQSELLDDVNRHVPTPPRDFVRHCHEQSVLTNLAGMQGKPVHPSPIKGFCPNHDHFLAIHKPSSILQKTTVLTPTTGTSYLEKCIASVQAQSLPGVRHLIVVDGPQHADKVHAIVESFRHKMPIDVMVLPFPSGKEGWNGHRIYASVPFLLDCDYIAYLDEDNFYHEDHLKNLYETLVKHKVDWAFSLRTIVDTDGTVVCQDNCESLGNFCHTVLAWDDFLIDTSCYFLKKEIAQALAPHWMYKARQGTMEADRAVTRFLLGHASFRGKGVPQHTLYYTTARTGDSVKPDFFLQGNAVLHYDFAAFPTVYIFHFNKQSTEKCLLNMHKNDRSYALDEWNPTLFRSLSKKYNLVNGFAMGAVIPQNAIAYVSLCHPHELPAFLFQRTDVKKIVFTLESPNIRHQDQWNHTFLFKKFHHLLTYWDPLLQYEDQTTFCPHNTHHLDFENPLDMALLHIPTKPIGRDVVIVLECRDLGGDYSMNGIPLLCLDPLRKHYVKDLTDITAYGIGWAQFHKNPRLKIGHTKHRSLDDQTTVDIIKDYTFVLVIENCNAHGYVSEKIYDAFIAGCIPLYYGNNNSRVNIPQDMYINLRNFETSLDLQKYLDGLSLQEIEAMRQRVLDGRLEVLKGVSTQAFAARFTEAYQKFGAR